MSEFCSTNPEQITVHGGDIERRFLAVAGEIHRKSRRFEMPNGKTKQVVMRGTELSDTTELILQDLESGDQDRYHLALASASQHTTAPGITVTAHDTSKDDAAFEWIESDGAEEDTRRFITTGHTTVVKSKLTPKQQGAVKRIGNALRKII